MGETEHNQETTGSPVVEPGVVEYSPETDSIDEKIEYLDGYLYELRNRARDSSYAYSINFKRMIETVKIDAVLGSLIYRDDSAVLGDIKDTRDSYLEKANDVGVDTDLANEIFEIIVEASIGSNDPETKKPLEGIGGELLQAIINELKEHAENIPMIWQNFLDNLQNRTVHATKIGMVKLGIKLLRKIKSGEATKEDVFTLDEDDVIDERQKEKAKAEFTEFCDRLGIDGQYSGRSYDAIHDSAVRAQLQVGELSYGGVLEMWFDEETSR